jgi:acyl-CoA reductase-like NAD-dependent aldehyde dehydrogenase
MDIQIDWDASYFVASGPGGQRLEAKFVQPLGPTEHAAVEKMCSLAKPPAWDRPVLEDSGLVVDAVRPEVVNLLRARLDELAALATEEAGRMVARASRKAAEAATNRDRWQAQADEMTQQLHRSAA